MSTGVVFKFPPHFYKNGDLEGKLFSKSAQHFRNSFQQYKALDFSG